MSIFCSNKEADTTTSSPNKNDSLSIILIISESESMVILFVSYPIPEIVRLKGKSFSIFNVKFPSILETVPIALLLDKNILIPTSAS